MKKELWQKNIKEFHQTNANVDVRLKTYFIDVFHYSVSRLCLSIKIPIFLKHAIEVIGIDCAYER